MYVGMHIEKDKRENHAMRMSGKGSEMPEALNSHSG